MTDYSIERDYWGRPYVTTDGGPLRYEKGRKSPVNAVAYQRISKLAGGLDDKGNLGDWLAARAMIGMAKSKSIYAQLAHLVSAHDDPWAVAEAKRPLKELIKKAQEAGGSDDAAGLGTAFHGLTEVHDNGMTPSFVPEDLKPWLEVYVEALRDWEPVLVEPFVVNDELQVAGSPDRYLRYKPSGKVWCGDIKTGTSEPDFPLKVMTQVAIGANSVLYEQSTGERESIDCSLTKGLLIHLPIRGGGKPRCDLYVLDLEAGWRKALLSAQVIKERKVDKLVKL